MKDIINILNNLSLMFGLSIIVLASYNIGLLEVITRPLNRLKSSRNVMLFWFILTVLISAVVNDTLTAIILVPMAMAYSNSRSIDKTGMVLAVAFGAVVAGELTQYGATNTIIEWTMLEKKIGHSVNLLQWSHLFFIPTFIAILICGMWLYFFWFKNETLDSYKSEVTIKIDMVFSLKSIIILGGIIITLITNKVLYTGIFTVLSLIIGKFNRRQFAQLPYKALYIWTGAYLLGNAINVYVKTYFHLALPANTYTIGGILVVLLVVGTMTNFITNSGLVAFLMPLVLGMNFHDNLWLFVLIVKAVDLSYCTILANGCLAVSSSHGLKQKYLLKAGLPIIILQVIAFCIYFYFMRGNISLQ